MQLGERIKKLRKEMNMTQREFASKLGLHYNLLAKYESGRTKPSVAVIAKISKFCEVPSDLLIHGKDEAYAKRSRINDEELLDLLRRIDNFKKIKRERIKWAIKALLNGDIE